MKILICDPLGAEGVQLLNKQPNYKVDEIPGLAKKDLLAKIEKYDALIVRSATRADREVIEAGKNLRVMARAGRPSRWSISTARSPRRRSWRCAGCRPCGKRRRCGWGNDERALQGR